MIPQQVHSVTIGAYNVSVLRNFYKELGWKETEESCDSYAVFRTTTILLSIFPLLELAKDAGLEDAVLPPHGFRGMTFSIHVSTPDEVDQAVRYVKKRGGEIVKPASDEFWGGRTAYFADPEFNVWEIAWNP